MAATVEATIDGLGSAHNVVVDDSVSRAYRGNKDSAFVTVIDTQNNTVVATLTAAAGATFDASYAWAFPEDGFAWTVSNTDGYIKLHQASNTVSLTIVGAYGYRAYYLNPHCWFIRESEDLVVALHPASGTFSYTLTLGSVPRYLAAGGDFVYVADATDNTVSVIHAASGTVSATIVGFNVPRGIDVDPGLSKLYVTNRDSDNLEVIHLPSLTRSATIGPFNDQPRPVRIDRTQHVACVGCTPGTGTSWLWLIDVNSDTVSQTFAMPADEDFYGIGVDETQEKFFCSSWEGRVIVISGYGAGC